MNNLRLLLVDDEEEFASTLAHRLQIRGYPTGVAVDGEEALNLLANNIYDVMVLDLMLPGLSGLDVLQQVKQQYPDLPVIMLTGQGSTREGLAGMRFGAFDFLMKPVDLDELITKITEAVPHRRAHGDDR
ncbi:MAG: response regulator [Desulfofustis sp. PB-SRB1]|jgi:DNA-binding response OmpR family regulator|nr:response regulator [Desulfofustis sp. PB-SRB1]MBM1004059.1 response regulator [Desulfofustis sp. PB-SRB1]HBH28340.1 response regulator [Desulfofustis sp.]HBH30862.1 response regulator [Desulfofustis sp.]